MDTVLRKTLSSIDISPLTTQISLGIARTTREPVPPPPPRPPQLHRRSSTPRHHARHEAQSADLFRSNLSPLQLLFVTMREYWRKSGHGAGHNSQVGPLPNIFGSLGEFECVVLELVGLSQPHAHHDRCRYDALLVRPLGNTNWESKPLPLARCPPPTPQAELHVPWELDLETQHASYRTVRTRSSTTLMCSHTPTRALVRRSSYCTCTVLVLRGSSVPVPVPYYR